MPTCTVAVYVAGTDKLARLYTEGNEAPAPNPFTASSTGNWSVYADGLQFDLKFISSGISVAIGNIRSYDSTIRSSAEAFRNPAQFGGVDCGAKINAAATDLGHAGVIIVTRSCGTSWTTPVNLSRPGQILRFTEGGTYRTSAPITLSGNGTGIEGLYCGQGDFNTPSACPVQIQEAGGSNLAALIRITGANVSLNSFQFDGNKNEQTSGGNGIECEGLRCSLDMVVASNFLNNGIQISSIGTGNQAAAAKLWRVTSYGNNNDGLLCRGSNDLWVQYSEFENNRGNGVELSGVNGCAGARLNFNDFGGNAGSGLKIGGGRYSGGQSSTGIFVTANQFGNNEHHDLAVLGWDNVSGNITARAITIQGNQFIGLCRGGCTSGTAPRTDTFDAIHIEDSIANTIQGNTISSAQPSGPAYRYGIREIQNSGHKLGVDEISGNFFTQAISGIPFGMAMFLSDNIDTGFHGNNENGASATLFSNPYFRNSEPLRWKDKAGQLLDVLEMGAENNLYIYGHPTKKMILLQPTPGRTSFAVTGTGIASDTAGLKHKRSPGGCATAPVVGANCTTTISWTTSFADANYTVNCVGDGITSGVPLSGGLTTKTSALVTFRTVAGTATAAQYTNIDCVAFHD